ncbi:MAG: hypothetical protein ACSHX5_04920 [Phycisphaerales bacterium]
MPTFRTHLPALILLSLTLTACGSKDSSKPTAPSSEQSQASKELASILTPEQQAHERTLQEIDALTAPYIELNNQLLDLGGIDPATVASIQDANNRIAMAEQLIEYNAHILEQYPILFNKLQGADTPQGIRQLKLVQDIRAINSQIFPEMIASLKIVREHFEISGLASDNRFYFGDDVPKETIDQFNAHLAAVDTLSKQQADLMSAYDLETEQEADQTDP